MKQGDSNIFNPSTDSTEECGYLINDTLLPPYAKVIDKMSLLIDTSKDLVDNSLN